MKKINIALLIAVISLMSLGLLKTQLQVSVLDDAGNFQQGAEVTLYNNADDYEADKKAFPTQKTDAKGRTKFKGLEAIDYFIHVEKGSKDNVLGGEQTGVLVEGKINKVNIIISD